jgi:hypothetical protein
MTPGGRAHGREPLVRKESGSLLASSGRVGRWNGRNAVAGPALLDSVCTPAITTMALARKRRDAR